MKFGRVAAMAGGLLMTACTTIPGSTVSDARLIGSEWIVDRIDGQVVLPDARPTLTFGSDGRVTGDTSCNRYFADYRIDGSTLDIGGAGVTQRACPPAVMDQERRFLDVFNGIGSYAFDPAGMLVLTTGTGVRMTARPASSSAATTFRCADGSTLRVSYPTSETARLLHRGRAIDMSIAVSGSGARYIGGGWQWWSKGSSEGYVAPLFPGETIATAREIRCTKQ